MGIENAQEVPLMENFIYMDHAATTPVDPDVLKTMEPWFIENFGNPSTLYSQGIMAAQAVEEARGKVAGTLGAEPEEIYFTSGGTESNNWAVKGIAESQAKKGGHIICSTIEHHAVLEPVKYLEKKGHEITWLSVDENGLVDPEDVRKAVRPDTVLLSVMYANNEVGTVQPIAEIGRIAKEAEVLFHTDAVQAVGKLPLDVRELGVDLLSLSGHKFYGPKGVGALYMRKQVKATPLLHGGAQERRRRAGTSNVPGIVGLGRALELATERMERDALREGIQARVPDVHLNGHPSIRLPGALNFRVEGIEGEAMILCLDMNRVGVSSGSACTTGSLEASHVLLAMGIPADEAHGSLRISLGRSTTKEHIDHFLEAFPPIAERLRDMSPIYNK